MIQNNAGQKLIRFKVRLASAGLLISFALSTVMLFAYQNCAPVKFEAFRATAALNGANGTNGSGGGSGSEPEVTPAGQDRYKDFFPDKKLVSGRPLNVILILDGSNSMSAIKEKTIATVSSLIDRLSEMDVNLILQPLDRTGASLSGVGKVFQFQGLNRAYFDPNVLQSAATGFEYFEETKYQIHFDVKSFLLSDSITTRLAKKAEVLKWVEQQSAYMSLGKDVGLCAVLTALEAKKYTSPPPAVFDNGSPTLLMMITNEDDESTLNSSRGEPGCSYGYLNQQRITQYTQLQFSWAYRYYDLDATIQLDGAPSNVTTQINLPIPRSDVPSQIGAVKSCPVDNFSLSDYCRVNSDAYACQSSLAARVRSCTEYIVSTQTYYDAVGNLSLAGKSCDELEPSLLNMFPYYFAKSCDLKKTSYPHAITENYFSMVPENTEAHQKNDIVLALLGSIKNNIGLENFYFVPIIHPSTTDCMLTVGARVGEKYKRLATALGDKQSAVIPICSNDYSKGLDKIQNFVTTVATGDFELPSEVAQSLKAITVIKRSGQRLTPALNVDYRLSGNNLIFTSGFISIDDTVRVSY
jgi:hypothetical protein